MKYQPETPEFETMVRDSFSKMAMMAHLGASLSSVRPGAVEVRLVHREELLQQGVVGQIQVRGAHVMKGYVGQDEIGKDNWFTTGDLGFILKDRLCVTGRLKDILMVNGRNFYAHDMEAIAEKVDGITPGRVAVVGSRDPQTGAERVIVFARIKSSPLLDEAEVLHRLKHEEI